MSNIPGRESNGNRYSEEHDGSGHPGNMAKLQDNHGLSPNHELSNYSQPESNQLLSMQGFLSGVELARHDISVLTQHISRISELHQAALSSPSPTSSAELEGHVAGMYQHNEQIRDRIKKLERDAVNTSTGDGAETRIKHVNLLKRSFQEQLMAYQREEHNYCGRYRAQIARQYRIANEGATEEEVQQAMDMDWRDEGVFQAALKSSRSKDAHSALNAVRSRQKDIKLIEDSFVMVAKLFKDMEDQVVAVTKPAERAAWGTEAAISNIVLADDELNRAHQHAVRARKMKWWTLTIAVAVILILALVLGLVFRPRKRAPVPAP